MKSINCGKFIEKINQLWKNHFESLTCESTVLPQSLSSHLWDRWIRLCRQRRWSRNQSSPQRPGHISGFIIPQLDFYFEEPFSAWYPWQWWVARSRGKLSPSSSSPGPAPAPSQSPPLQKPEDGSIQFWWMFGILLLTHQPKARWGSGNPPVSRWEHSWQRSRRGEWSGCNMRISGYNISISNIKMEYLDWVSCK